MKKYSQKASAIIAVIVAALVLVADQVSKYLIITDFRLGESRTIIDGVLNFTYINNSGAAFGIFKDQTFLFLALTLVIIIVCASMLIRKTYKSPIMLWSILLILSGGLGNMIDRIFRGGNVVDFFELTFVKFAIFNVADCAVTVGTGLVLLYFIIDIINSARRRKNGEDEKPDPDDVENSEECEPKD